MKHVVLMIMVLAVAITGLGFKGENRIVKGTVISREDGLPIPGATVTVRGTGIGTQTNSAGKYTLSVPEGKNELVFTFLGAQTMTVKIDGRSVVDVALSADSRTLNEVVVSAAGLSVAAPVRGYYNRDVLKKMPSVATEREENTESYKAIAENKFLEAKSTPLSTFSVDVDAASYSNFRRFINNGELPPADAIRIEEMINYFKYDLDGPKDASPVAIHTELSAAPWNPKHRLLRIALKAKTIPTENLPASNLVFLIDVSGSMNEPNKLPLVKSSLKMLADQLRAQDRVSLVVYAGAAGVVLPATPGNKKNAIYNAIDNLSAGGSTAGGAGIKLAYKIAAENLVKKGNNRVILATDGDFNVGASSDDDMEKLIEKERESGISLSVLGFGIGNYKDSKMETLADKGNGNYAYIDNITEARKTLVSEFGGTLFTVAKDVKLQVEFNPARVKAYRLLGYENRVLNKEDFNDDKKDAGDMGSGHNVTAFYEIIPTGVADDFAPSVDPLKYQKPAADKPVVSANNELLTIKFRYKEPTSMQSKLSQAVVNDSPVTFSKTGDDFRFATAVAEIGMLLRDSPFKQKADFSQALGIAKAAKGPDTEGYRAEFIRLAESARLLKKTAMAEEEEE